MTLARRIGGWAAAAALGMWARGALPEELQHELGLARDHVHLVSISIDPEFDTLARLHEYARRFGAGPEWQHYGGTLAASVAAQRAFGVYQPGPRNSKGRR
jgi:cytochrome oxidase Cu insertion factor (SCO1/SenC/PrrC family)